MMTALYIRYYFLSLKNQGISTSEGAAALGSVRFTEGEGLCVTAPPLYAGVDEKSVAGEFTAVP